MIDDPYQVALGRLRKQFYCALGISVLLVAGLYYEYAQRHWGGLWPRRGASPAAATAAIDDAADPVIATVNGHELRRDMVVHALEHYHGLETLRGMVAQQVILDAAAQANLKLDDPDSVLALQHLGDHVTGVGYEVESRQLQAQLLLRKLALKSISDKQQHDFYNEFRNELTQYEIFVISTNQPAETRRIETALQKGQGFADVSAQSHPPGTRLGFMNTWAMEQRLGPGITSLILAAAEHTPGGGVNLPAIRLRRATLFVRIGSVKSSYSDLKSYLDDVMAAADSKQLLADLQHRSKIDYPLLEANRQHGPASGPSSPASTEPDESIFAPVPAANQTGKVFAPLPPASKKDGVFAPVPSANQNNDVFGRLPSANKGGSGNVFAPLPSAVKPGGAFPPMMVSGITPLA